jgi:sugar phosphate isomerase/epimerase
MMLDNARRCADLFECQVAVEGHYPSKGDALLVSNWGEYRRLFESGVPYALDLSHLNIGTEQSRSRDDGLVAEMLACERCIEVHVSDNDGTGDWHRVCDRQPWWYRLLTHAHPGAILISEGNQVKRRTIG